MKSVSWYKNSASSTNVWLQFNFCLILYIAIFFMQIFFFTYLLMSLCLNKIVLSGKALFLERIGLRKSSFELIGSFTSIYRDTASVVVYSRWKYL